MSAKRAWEIALAWAGLAAGVLDLLENAGIWLEIRRAAKCRTFARPLS